MKKKLYCNFCGRPLGIDLLDGKERQVCEGCREIYYENPLPVASVILPSRDREILLVKRDREPFRGMWCLPIGFAETGESIEGAALRELREETGITGRILQLIDASSHLNPLYGELLVVIFEAEKVSGIEEAGDDASECGYFPIKNLPKLAFDAQERAVRKYVELKKDLWNMHDSFNAFVRGASLSEVSFGGALLSDELVSAVQANSKKIVDLWIADITSNPSTKSYHDFSRKELSERAAEIFGQLGAWLKGEKDENRFKSFYRDLGRKRREGGILVEDLVSSLSLLKKHIWMFTHSVGVWEGAVDFYRMFELGERLVYFFDMAAYYTIAGYREHSSDTTIGPESKS